MAEAMTTHWSDLLYEMYPDPIDPDEPDLASRGLEEGAVAREVGLRVVAPGA
jgi:hypothetical protein